LARVAEVRHDGRNPLGARPRATVDHDQQFHQVLVDRRAGGLHDEDVAAAHILVDLALDLPVGEAFDTRAAQREAEVLADLRG
jgi:hypothetical protein